MQYFSNLLAVSILLWFAWKNPTFETYKSQIEALSAQLRQTHKGVRKLIGRQHANRRSLRNSLPGNEVDDLIKTQASLQEEYRKDLTVLLER